MARQEQDREDLLAQATALVERVEFTLAGTGNQIVVGFRSDGAISFFLDAERVYQFNAAGELRRAYVGDLLYKAELGRLAGLRRVRTAEQVVLLRSDLDAAATDDFLSHLAARLMDLKAALATGRASVTGSVPAAADVCGRVQGWLNSFEPPPRLAQSPRAQ